MTPEHWKRVAELFEAAVEQEPAARAEFLARAAAGDVALAEEVLRMLASDERAGTFLSRVPGLGSLPGSDEHFAARLELLREENPSLARELQTLLKEHDVLGDEGFLGTQPAASATPAPMIGQKAGAYTLESPIGQGGMGTVWLARRSDGRFEGRAAVKILNIGLIGGAAEQRFKREGSILARLAHPNIAHLIDAGVSPSGQPYLLLEYVEGERIDVYCNEHALDVEARIRLFLDVLAAVAHAHANLIVHRDIKPSNVLVTDEGQVKLLDFGIAKLLEGDTPLGEATALTREGERALTPAYAAPEQVTGGSITTATDVYALGVLLYLLLTGKHPAESSLSTPAGLLRAIVETEPLRPSDTGTLTKKRRRGLRGDVDTIVAKALKKNPPERYASATAFAEDLRRYLGHQTISARPDTFAYRAVRFLRRYRVPVAAAAMIIASLAAGLFVANRQRTIAETRNDRLRLMQAERMLDQDPTSVLAWLKSYQSNTTSWPKVRELAADALSRGIATHVLRHEGYVLGMDFSPDGTKLASSSEDGTIRVWDVPSGNQLRKIVLDLPATNVSFSADGKWLAAGGRDSFVYLWEVDGSQAHRFSGHQGPITQIAFHPHENTLVTAGRDGTVRLWDTARGTANTLDLDAGEVNQIVFSPNGYWLGSASLNGSIRLWKRPFQRTELALRGQLEIGVIGFSPDSQWVAWAGVDRSINLLQLKTGRRLILAGHQAEVTWLSFSPDSQSLASSSFDKTVRVWDLAKQNSRILAGHENRVKVVSFSPDGRLLASAGSDKSVRLWDPAESGSRVLIGHRASINRILFQPNGATFCTMSIDGTIRLWSLSPYESQMQRLRGASFNRLALSNDGVWVAASSIRRILAWNRRTGQMRTFEDSVELAALTFSSAGNELFVGKVTGVIDAWNLETNERRQLLGHTGKVRALVPLPGAAMLASAGDDGAVRLWSTADGTGEVVQRHRGVAAGLTTSADSREIISGGDDGVIRVFDRSNRTFRILVQISSAIEQLVVSEKGELGIASGNWTTVLDREGKSLAQNEHGGRVTAIAFSSDGEIFASASRDRTIRIWNSATRQTAVLRGHVGPVLWISFSKQGHRLASASEDTTTRIWDVDLGVDQILRGNQSYVMKVGFSPNDELVATVGMDQTLRLWPSNSSLDVPRSPRHLMAWLSGLTTMVLPQHEGW